MLRTGLECSRAAVVGRGPFGRRLGVDRAGLFNGLIPITSLASVALTGTGTITPLRLLGALAVLAGVILGLSRTRQVPPGTAHHFYNAVSDEAALTAQGGGAG